MAISSHSTHDVKMFATGGKPGRWTAPAGSLRNVDCPHGLRFSNDDRHVLVADAASPVINVYRRQTERETHVESRVLKHALFGVA